ncbi:hypothetical protein Acr_10g0009930 [Actinidia rufa]|uniref:Uncharacterized protein n=1 Tax=Actinidia rufa TaxID=165716 RepID=A0A7J0FA82_9ERIC|nr:hypothetical protein Acr_10g0009930 [Actinidia rufa]
MFEGTVKDSVDSELGEEFEAREELHGGGSREFGNEFNIRMCGFMIGLTPAAGSPLFTIELNHLLYGRRFWTSATPNIRRSLFQWERGLESRLLDTLNAVAIDVNGKDMLVWLLEGNEEYSVKSFCNMIFHKHAYNGELWICPPGVEII